MGIKHVRIMFHLLIWHVYIWNHDLVEVRYTHVHDNNKHCTSMRQVYHMSNMILQSTYGKALSSAWA